MTVYYLDNSSTKASDSNNGLSPDSPFASLAAINGRTFQPGDVISIKAGTTYSGTLSITSDGTASAPITFTSYGTGAKPLITGSQTHNIDLSGANYIVLDGLAVKGAKEGGVNLDANSNHNIIQNMEISNVGFGVEVAGQYNKFLSNYVHDTKMVNNTPGGDDDYGAVAFSIYGSNNEFAFNKVERAQAKSYDYGMDGGGFETWRSVSNISIHDNWVQDSNGFFEAGGLQGDYVTGIKIDHNVSLNNGGFHWLHNAGGNFGINFGTLQISYNTIIEQRAAADASEFGFGGPVFSGYKFDHNIVSLNQGWTIFNQPVSDRSYNWYSGPALNPDGSSPLNTGEVRGTDPLFVSSTDFHLQSGSSAAGLGAYGTGTGTPPPPTTPVVQPTEVPTTTTTAPPPAPTTTTDTPPADPTVVQQGKTLVGTQGSDNLSGDGGDDVLKGLAGNDRLLGNDGSDSIEGGFGRDTIVGGAGDDWLNGGSGNDVLTGGAGDDTFFFNSPRGGVERITDFDPGHDHFMLGTGFAAIGPGALSADEFRVGRSAADANDHIIYNPATGDVFYDADGKGGAAAIKFAHVEPGTSLSYSDFFHT